MADATLDQQRQAEDRRVADGRPAESRADFDGRADALNGTPRVRQLRALRDVLGQRAAAGGAAPIQRRASVAVDGLNRLNEGKPVYFRQGEYANDRVYEQPLGAFDDESAYTGAAAQAAGDIGAPDELDHATDNTSNANPAAAGAEKWVTSSEQMGRGDQPHAIEPFNVKITGTVGGAPASMTFHFGYYNFGYIMSQSQGAVTADIEDYAGAAAGSVSYSNVHAAQDEIAENSLRARMAGGLSAGDEGSDERWDARTIVAGEGARFVPVRRLHTEGALTNASRFFCSVNGVAPVNNDAIRWITLRNLWGIWGRQFSSRFNVDAEWIATVVRAAGGGVNRVVGTYDQMDDNIDYDLDRDAPR